MFDINKTEIMTSRERANRLADEDEKRGEPEREIIVRRVSYHPEKQFSAIPI